MNIKKQIIPLSFYSYVHLILWDISKKGILEKRIATNHIGRFLTLDKRIRNLIIKELELLGYIENQGKFTIKIKQPIYNKDKILNHLSEKIGLF